jgi:pantoate--beta-alanine ligase
MSLAIGTGADELRGLLEPLRAEGRTIGFVPTMGALHEGHLSLVDAARKSTDVVVASIFVNPLQFGEGEDLDCYPRTIEADKLLLEERGTSVLFLPDVADMYPEGYATRVEMSGLTDVLCGASRPGHFSGVLTVVLKLFNLVQPTRAFFGQKDYQQALVIRRMVRDLNLPLAVDVCPIVRESDGLAMSSRNRYLDEEQRSQAAALRKAFLDMDAAWRAGERSHAKLLEIGSETVATSPLFRIEYLEIRDPETLTTRESEVRAGDLVALAAHMGTTRLIDNGLLGRD